MSSLNLIAKALDFAAKKHRDQRRKDHASSPYINHPIALVNILVNEAEITDTNTLVAALLHDTIEDTDTTPEELEKIFGKKIRSVVEEVTDDQRLPRRERKRLQIEHACHLSCEAALVKIADKIANLRDLQNGHPQHWTKERKASYRQWAKQVVDNIREPHDRLLAIFERTLKSESEDC